VALLATWFEAVVVEFADRVWPLDAEAAQVWGRLRVLHA
jgi:hypothetical protein